MGLFDPFTGTRRPAPGVPAMPAAEVHAALLALNGPDQKFVLRDGAAPGVHLVAEWRITDPKWRSVFGSVTRVNRTLMKLDPAKNEVRAADEQWSVNWVNSEPRMVVAAAYRRGQIASKQATFTRDTNGKLAKQSFSTAELKPLLRDAVTDAGWTWRAVLVGRL